MFSPKYEYNDKLKRVYSKTKQKTSLIYLVFTFIIYNIFFPFWKLKSDKKGKKKNIWDIFFHSEKKPNKNMSSFCATLVHLSVIHFDSSIFFNRKYQLINVTIVNPTITFDLLSMTYLSYSTNNMNEFQTIYLG